jgi:hypothetical protein
VCTALIRHLRGMITVPPESKKARWSSRIPPKSTAGNAVLPPLAFPVRCR